MKKQIVYIILILAFTIGMFSCADLDLPSDGRVKVEDIFSNYHRTRNYWNSCRVYMPQVTFSYNDTPLASFCDEAHDASDNVSGTSVFEWYNNRTNPTWNPLTGRDINGDPWDRYFQGIWRCNFFLESFTNPELTTYEFKEDESNSWIAEVRVMRAYYYLQLIKRYGGVPIMEQSYELAHDYSNERRFSFEECADFIIAECDAALATKETEGIPSTFRWAVNDGDVMLTRGFAHAVRSQTALYAASPLWYVSGSKYTWEKAAEIAKESLDACLARGYQLYNLPVAETVAQNPYAYYFIQQADRSRSRDKETIYETTAYRTNVWSLAGTPITIGMQKAGAGPSQELVDAYETRNGEPVLDLNQPYLDANHLQPNYNPANTLYNPNDPYANRDPRFYGSIYYNNSPRWIDLNPTIGNEYYLSLYDAPWSGWVFNYNVDEPEKFYKEDGTLDYLHFPITGGNPNIAADIEGDWVNDLADREGRPYVRFEYRCPVDIPDTRLYMVTLSIDPAPAAPNIAYMAGVFIPKTEGDNWGEFMYDISGFFGYVQDGHNAEFVTDPPAEGWGHRGPEDCRQLFRFDPGSGTLGLNVPEWIDVKNFRIQYYIPPPIATPVETFVGGNCGISDQITDTRFTRTGYYMRKFNNAKSDQTTDEDGLMKIFRLGELYLNFAEAACEASRLVEAKAAVDAIRLRAGMPQLPDGLSQEQLRQRIRNERRIELAFEEHRFFDVRRWKILNETDNFVTGMRITRNGDGTLNYQRIKLPDRGTHTEKYLMLPIRQEEIIKVEAATGANWQNPGW